MPKDVHATFYRIAQEALNNVVKHAWASQVTLSFREVPITPQQAAEKMVSVRLVVEDDGVGFSPEDKGVEHLGLGIMRERAESHDASKFGPEERLPYVSVATDPTMGGVSASLAMLGDVNVAEPKALIGFAGPRVIEQTVRETLPEGFQRSEFLLEHGAIDMIVDRREMSNRIANLIAILMNQHLTAS